MGTRSITKIKDEEGDVLCIMYRAYDGFLIGHGLELANFLSNFKIVQGLSNRWTTEKVANGMECLAAQMFAHFKQRPGNIYLYSAAKEDNEFDHEFTYIVELVEENLLISVAHGSEPMFAEDLAVKLNPSDFINFIMTKTREESESS